MEKFSDQGRMGVSDVQKFLYKPVGIKFLKNNLLKDLAELFKERDFAVEEDDKIQKSLIDIKICEHLYLDSCAVLGNMKFKTGDFSISDKTAWSDVAFKTASTLIKKFKENKIEFESSNYNVDAILGCITAYSKNGIKDYFKQKEFQPIIVYGEVEESEKKKLPKRNISMETKIDGEEYLTLEDTLQSNQYDPVKSFNDCQLHEDLMEILNELVELEKTNVGKTIINLSFIEKLKGNELSQKEIAEIAGCSAPYVFKKEKQVLDKMKKFKYLNEYLE